MEGNVQTKANIPDKTETEASVEYEHVSKKLKVDESVDKDLKSDVEMTLAQENQPTSSSSSLKILETTSDKESTSYSSKKSKRNSESLNNDDSDECDDDLDIEYTPKEGFNYPIEMDASDMLDEVDSIVDGRYPTVTERYLTPYYQLDIPHPGDDVCVLVHSNRVCMFTLAPSHTIYQENKKIVKCDYQVSEKLDRLKNKVSGKAKHGAQPLQNNSNLCRLTCHDDSVYVVKCCLIGKLVEVNERLVQDPELLKKPPHNGGYIAIALPNLKHFDKIKSKLLDQKAYEEALKKRKEKDQKEKNEKSDDALVVEGTKETKNEHTESVDSKVQKESETKIDVMEIVES